MLDIDITDLVEFGNNDGECLPIMRCVCGNEFYYWKFIISIYRDDPYHCDACGRGLYFTCAIRVFERVTNDYQN